MEVLRTYITLFHEAYESAILQQTNDNENSSSKTTKSSSSIKYWDPVNFFGISESSVFIEFFNSFEKFQLSSSSISGMSTDSLSSLASSHKGSTNSLYTSTNSLTSLDNDTSLYSTFERMMNLNPCMSEASLNKYNDDTTTTTNNNNDTSDNKFIQAFRDFNYHNENVNDAVYLEDN